MKMAWADTYKVLTCEALLLVCVCVCVCVWWYGIPIVLCAKDGVSILSACGFYCSLRPECSSCLNVLVLTRDVESLCCDRTIYVYCPSSPEAFVMLSVHI